MNFEKYKVEEIQRFLKDLEFTKFLICENTPNSYMRKILKFIKPVNRLQLTRNPFIIQNDFILSGILIQNLDMLIIEELPLLTLDDLLIINISSVVIKRAQLTEKDFNRFLKHWMAGANPRLEFLSIGGYEQGINEKVLWRGIQMNEIRNMGTGIIGNKIKRKDGTEALVRIDKEFIIVVN